MKAFMNFIKKRFSPQERFGLTLTIGALVTLFFSWFVYVIFEDVVTKETLYHSDLRVLNLVALYRTPELNKIMLAITYLGKWEVVFLGVFFVSIIFALQKKWIYFWSLIASVAFGQIIVTIIKDIFHRARPPLANALVVENSFSFPSGHSLVAVTFYGFLTFLIYRSLKSKLARFFTVFLGLLIIAMIGFSRIYLGVHFPSDVLSGYLIGAAWVTVLATSIEIFDKNILDNNKVPSKILLLSGLFFILWLIYFGFYTFSHQKTVTPAPPNVINLNQSQSPAELFVNLPKTSETLTGRPMEPINIIVVGTKTELDQAFAAAGWSQTDPITFNSSVRIAFDSIFSKPYPKAPGTPSFWDYQPNEFAYEKATGSNPSQRFHIHFWQTQYSLNGIPILFATAHFDKSIVFRDYIIPTHEIDPNIDSERSRVLSDLENTGMVVKTEEFQLLPPLSGKNAAGSLFYTDGKAEIIFLK